MQSQTIITNKGAIRNRVVFTSIGIN